MTMDTAGSDDPQVTFARLGRFVTEAMARLGVPGVAIGVIEDRQEYTAGFGVHNVKHPLPVDADTLFQIGSTSKTVTATVAMRLVEQGALHLDAPLRTYLPELRLADEEVAAQVTLRHLFTHTGGWEGDYFANTGDGDDALARIVAQLVELPQVFPLGQVFSYNNAGFYLAGRVIEVATGKTYEQTARELVLAPLGMTRSFFSAKEIITDRVAVGHRVGEHGPEVLRDWALARAANPAGGIISTVVDQLRYARFQLGDGTAPDGSRLLTPETMAMMQAPLMPVGCGLDAVGVTWLLHTIGDTKLVQHGGATNGQLSSFVLAPARGFAITVLTNADRGSELHQEVTGWALEHYLGVVDPDPEPLNAPRETLARYGGRYSARGADLDLRLADDVLSMHVIYKGGFPEKDSPPRPAPPPAPLALYGTDRMIVLDGPMKHARLEFVRGADGRIAYLRLGVRAYRRQDTATLAE